MDDGGILRIKNKDMKLPNCNSVYIPPSKLNEYLLSETHIIGKSKARVFRACGFNEDNVKLFEKGLLNIARNETVSEVISSLHGKKYIIEGFLETPNKTIIKVRTIWVIETKESNPRFVTAYPINSANTEV